MSGNFSFDARPEVDVIEEKRRYNRERMRPIRAIRGLASTGKWRAA